MVLKLWSLHTTTQLEELGFFDGGVNAWNILPFVKESYQRWLKEGQRTQRSQLEGVPIGPKI